MPTNNNNNRWGTYAHEQAITDSGVWGNEVVGDDTEGRPFSERGG